MENSTFSPGLFSHDYLESLRELRLRKISIEKKKKISQSYTFNKSSPSIWKFNSNSFNLLPNSSIPKDISFLTTMIPTTMKQQNSFLRTFHSLIITKSTLHSIFLELRKIILKNRKIRFLLRKFLLHWLYKRLTKMNEEDIVTLESPKKPIYLVNWKTRTIWTYEATTIQKDITNRLQNHDGFFEKPLQPRNLFTNSPLTQAQLISIWNQLVHTNIPISTFLSAFRQLHWSLPLFSSYYSLPLQLHSFTDTMKDLSHIDSRERLLDFIDYVHEFAGIPIFINTYSFFINYAHSDKIPLIKKWRLLCIEFYTIEMIHSYSFENSDRIQHSIVKKAIHLAKKQSELVALKSSILRYRNS